MTKVTHAFIAAIFILASLGLNIQKVRAEDSPPVFWFGGAESMSFPGKATFGVSFTLAQDTEEVSWDIYVEICPEQGFHIVKTNGTNYQEYWIQTQTTVCREFVEVTVSAIYNGVQYQDSKIVKLVPNIFDFQIEGPTHVMPGQRASFNMIRNLEGCEEPEDGGYTYSVQLLDKWGDETETFYASSFDTLVFTPTMELEGDWGLRWSMTCVITETEWPHYTVYQTEKVMPMGSLHIGDYKLYLPLMVLGQ